MAPVAMPRRFTGIVTHELCKNALVVNPTARAFERSSRPFSPWAGSLMAHEILLLPTLEEQPSRPAGGEPATDHRLPDPGRTRKKPRLTEAQVAALVSVPHLGIDEAGRGCLAGPVVAAAVFFPEHLDWEALFPGLTDSKQMPGATREALAPRIQGACAWGVGLAWPLEIDALDIVNANFRAMCRALIMLARALDHRGAPGATRAGGMDGQEFLGRGLPLYVDGNLAIRPDAWKSCALARPQDWHAALFPGREPVVRPSAPPLTPLPTDFPFSQQAIIGGDALIPAVSAASVLAKTRRDAIMTRFDKDFPAYGFARHKGYGTEEHRTALQRFGPCPLHRNSFLTGILPAAVELSLF